MLSVRKRHVGYQSLNSAARVAKSLLGWIASAQFPLHSKLPAERALSERLGVSRAMLRDALDILESQGRIWRHVGKGTFVGGKPASVHSSAEDLGPNTTLFELLEARTLIEPMVARLAAKRAKFSDIELIAKYYRSGSQAGDWDTWDTWDDLFHRAIAEASGSGVMISIIDHIFRLKKDSNWCIRRARKFNPHLKKAYANHHDEITCAISSRNPEDAEFAMLRHINSISKGLGSALTWTGE
jgi:DNA-binding FadR family transcriptional regulator